MAQLRRVTDPAIIARVRAAAAGPTRESAAMGAESSGNPRRVTDPAVVAKVRAAAGLSPDERIAGAFEDAAPMADRQLSTGLQAFARGAAQGASFGLMDEANAAATASGLPRALDLIPGLGPLTRIGVGAARTYLDPAASETYNRTLESERRANEISATEHPVASVAGDVTGAIVTAPVTPMATLFKAATWVGRAGNAAATGAGYGFASGFGRGGDGFEERLVEGVKTAAFGAAAGGAASPLIDVAAAGGRKLVQGARSLVDPLTRGGRERVAASTLDAAASDPAAVREALRDVGDELVPGSSPTVFQKSGDMGLGGLERGVAAQHPEAFMTRRGEQNAGRLSALEDIQAEGHPEAVAAALREQLAAIDDMTTRTVEDATAVASNMTGRLRGEGTPEGYGATFRSTLDDTRKAVKELEDSLWRAVDSDGSLALPVSQVSQAAKSSRQKLPASAKAPEGEEAAILSVAQSYGRVVPFSEVTALRSRLSTAMREELFARGRTPAYARMSQLRGALERDLEGAITLRVADEAQAVMSGTMRAEDTIAGKLRREKESWLVDRVARAAGEGGGASIGRDARPSASGPSGIPRIRGTARETNGGFGVPSRDPRLSGDDLQPNFDEAALERLRTATAATRERAELFDKGPIGAILRRSGRDGPFNVPSSAVPQRIFAPGPRGFESVQAFRQAAGDDHAMLVLQDYAASRLRGVAERADGSLDPAKVATWRARHADALRAFPALDARFADAGRAADAMETAATVRKAAIDAYQKGLIGRLLGVEAPEDVTRIVGGLFQRSDAMAQMRRLANLTRGDP